MKERIIGISMIAAVITVISFMYLKGDGLAEIEKRIEARQSVTVEEASIQSDLIYPWVYQVRLYGCLFYSHRLSGFNSFFNLSKTIAF